MNNASPSFSTGVLTKGLDSERPSGRQDGVASSNGHFSRVFEHVATAHHSLSTVVASEGVKSVFVGAALSLHSLFQYVVVWVVEHAMAGWQVPAELANAYLIERWALFVAKIVERTPPTDSHCLLA